MPAAELVYFLGCPNVDEARAQLARALVEANLPLRWVEYQTDDPALPERARGFGSPTILVDGKDVTGAVADDSGEACRLYIGDAGAYAVAPSVASIVTALLTARSRGV